MSTHTITYVQGDATQPIGPSPQIIIHVCNDVRKWGAGFVLALTRRFGLQPKKQFLAMEPRLGTVGLVNVGNNVYVANMIAQHGVGRSNPKLDYKALEACLHTVFATAQYHKCTLHGPMFGAGLAGGNWNKIAAMLQKMCQKYSTSITIYQYGR